MAGATAPAGLNCGGFYSRFFIILAIDKIDRLLGGAAHPGLTVTGGGFYSRFFIFADLWDDHQVARFYTVNNFF